MDGHCEGTPRNEMKRAVSGASRAARKVKQPSPYFTPRIEAQQVKDTAVFALLAQAFRSVERASVLAANGSAPGFILGAVDAANDSLASAKWALEFERVLRKRGER